MTPFQLKAIFPKCMDITSWAGVLDKIAVEFEINTPERMAAFVAQCGHESAEFNRLRENLSYSARGLMATWPTRFPTDAIAVAFARNPQRIANYVYANRMGNGPPESNDGWNYRGGGLIQLTGRANYRAAGKAIGVPLETAPSKIEQPLVAARAAGQFWQSHGLNELADSGEFEKITETINGPAKLGLAERKAFWEKAKYVLGGA
jgi:putative chitinase